MGLSDSRLSIVTALSGFALIRFPTRRCRLRWTEPGLSGCADALSLPAAALYTVPAVRILSRCIPVRGRLRLQGTGSPLEKLQLNWRNRCGYDDAEMAFTSVAARKFASPSCQQVRALSSASPDQVARGGRGPGYRVSESLPELIPFIQQVHQHHFERTACPNTSDAPPQTPCPP